MSKLPHFFAVDLGATSGRTILGTLQNNRLDLKELTRFQNKIICIHDIITENASIDTNCIKEIFNKSLEYLRIYSFEVISWNDYVFRDYTPQYIFDPIVIKYIFFDNRINSSLYEKNIFNRKLTPTIIWD